MSFKHEEVKVDSQLYKRIHCLIVDWVMTLQILIVWFVMRLHSYCTVCNETSIAYCTVCNDTTNSGNDTSIAYCTVLNVLIVWLLMRLQ